MSIDKNQPQGKGKERKETVAGREITIKADGLMIDGDGVVVTPEEYAFLKEIDAGASGFETKGLKKQNDDLVFWKAEVQKKDGEPFEPNPIRGLVLSIFRRPEWLESDEDEDRDDAGRLRIACFVLLTMPTWVGMRGKKQRIAQPGERVFMDLNHATRPIVEIARPRIVDGMPHQMAEVLVVPKFKEPFQYTFPRGHKKAGQTETRQAWRMNIYGGFGYGNGFKQYMSAEEIAKKLGARSLPPSILSEEDAAQMLGLGAPGAIDTTGHALPEGAPRALSQHASN